MDSPRGRILLMRVGHEEGSEISPEMVTHFDRCLGCMACVTACPSGVQYDKLIERVRPQIERNAPRPARERAFRRLIFALFTHPGRLRALVPVLVAQERLGLTPRIAAPLGRPPARARAGPRRPGAARPAARVRPPPRPAARAARDAAPAPAGHRARRDPAAAARDARARDPAWPRRAHAGLHPARLLRRRE